MPVPRSQSRATSEVFEYIKSEVTVEEELDIKPEISPSLLHQTPKREPTSSFVSPTASDDSKSVSIDLSEVGVKVELVDSDEEAELLDEVPELSAFGALRLSEIPRLKGGPSSVMSTEEAKSTIDS